MTANAARRSPLTDGRLALVAGLALLAILTVGLAPTILREQTRDWIAYEQAAERLTARRAALRLRARDAG